MAGPATERPLRRDAERNRQRILVAAREVFAQRGLEATMDDVARHAGVGVGTVYRRFPDKHVLIDALFEARLAAVVAAAEHALADPDPWRGLVTFLDRQTELQSADVGLRQLLVASEPGRERVRTARERIAPRVAALVERAQDAGALRADLAATDVPLINIMLAGVIDFTDGIAPDAWRRLLGIVLDGLRPHRDAPTPLPSGPLAFEQIEDAMRVSLRAR